MYLERIIAEKRRLIAKKVDPDSLVIKVNRACAEWITLHEHKINWDTDEPKLMGTPIVVDDAVKNDFTITLKGGSNAPREKGQKPAR